MRSLVLITLILTLAGCATTNTPNEQPLATRVKASVESFNASVETLFNGKADLPTFEATDLQNAKAIFDDRFAITGNLYDKAGSGCASALLVHLPEIQSLTAAPTAPKLAAPVTGIFSGIAAAQVTAEDVQAQAASKALLLRNGIPPEVHIACSYLLVQPSVLLHGLTTIPRAAPTNGKVTP